MFNTYLAKKVSVFGVILVRIFLHSDPNKDNFHAIRVNLVNFFSFTRSTAYLVICSIYLPPFPILFLIPFFVTKPRGQLVKT